MEGNQGNLVLRQAKRLTFLAFETNCIPKYNIITTFGLFKVKEYSIVTILTILHSETYNKFYFSNAYFGLMSYRTLIVSYLCNS